MILEFVSPKSIVHGAGARKELLNQVGRLGSNHVLFVTDSYIMNTGLITELAQPLLDAGVNVSVFSQVQPDPTVENVREGFEMLQSSHADVIVAVGGGSAIDAAKAISVLSTNPEPLSQYMGYHKIPNAGLPLIAIPTTAGTGSEATMVTVISDSETNIKMMILDHHLMPTVAIVDFELSISMPPALTAHVGVDTLTHAIEAYVSVKANAMTDHIALSCIDLVTKNLFSAWSDPSDATARRAMSVAACQGGMSFTNSSVALVHGMSRPLGILFHLAHGLSNAILLPAVTRFSVEGAKDRYATIARVMDLATTNDSDEKASMALVMGLEKMNSKLKIPKLRDCTTFSRAYLEQHVFKMAEDALNSGSPQNNPKIPTIAEIVELYKEAW